MMFHSVLFCSVLLVPWHHYDSYYYDDDDFFFFFCYMDIIYSSGQWQQQCSQLVFKHCEKRDQVYINQQIFYVLQSFFSLLSQQKTHVSADSENLRARGFFFLLLPCFFYACGTELTSRPIHIAIMVFHLSRNQMYMHTTFIC